MTMSTPVLLVVYVPYKSGGPEAATQAATTLTKLEKHAYTTRGCTTKLGDMHGYVLSQVDAPDERWVYNFIARHT